MGPGARWPFSSMKPRPTSLNWGTKVVSTAERRGGLRQASSRSSCSNRSPKISRSLPSFWGKNARRRPLRPSRLARPAGEPSVLLPGLRDDGEQLIAVDHMSFFVEDAIGVAVQRVGGHSHRSRAGRTPRTQECGGPEHSVGFEPDVPVSPALLHYQRARRLVRSCHCVDGGCRPNWPICSGSCGDRYGAPWACAPFENVTPGRSQQNIGAKGQDFELDAAQEPAACGLGGRPRIRLALCRNG